MPRFRYLVFQASRELLPVFLLALTRLGVSCYTRRLDDGATAFATPAKLSSHVGRITDRVVIQRDIDHAEESTRRGIVLPTEERYRLNVRGDGRLAGRYVETVFAMAPISLLHPFAGSGTDWSTT